jgi:hypothetical protein
VRFVCAVMNVTIQMGPLPKSKGTTNHQAGWKGASTPGQVLAEIGHSPDQNRPLFLEQIGTLE